MIPEWNVTSNVYLRGYKWRSTIRLGIKDSASMVCRSGAPAFLSAGGEGRSCFMHLILLLIILVVTPLTSAASEPIEVTDSFTLNADLSGGDVVCPANVPTYLGVGTQSQIPLAGSWQVAWHSTFYVTFSSDVPEALQFIFLVYNQSILEETVTYNVEPLLFAESQTREFSFAVGTYGNDGDASGIVSSTAPFPITVFYRCVSQGQPVTVKGSSHILQVMWQE